MPWLLCDGHPVASVEVAKPHRDTLRRYGPRGIEGAVHFPKLRAVSTFGMKVPVQVAICDEDLVVRKVRTLRPNRIRGVAVRSGTVVAAADGAFQRWDVRVGSQLEVRR